MKKSASIYITLMEGNECKDSTCNCGGVDVSIALENKGVKGCELIKHLLKAVSSVLAEWVKDNLTDHDKMDLVITLLEYLGKEMMEDLRLVAELWLQVKSKEIKAS